eukprot:1143089-Pelagomonas_calceolata.AAC.6
MSGDVCLQSQNGSRRCAATRTASIFTFTLFRNLIPISHNFLLVPPMARPGCQKDSAVEALGA